MTTFTIIPSYGSQASTAPRVRQAVFGDGYQQRCADGINTHARSWSLAFNGDKARIDSVDEFLTLRSGIESFMWVPPSGDGGLWICSAWALSVDDYNQNSLSATFTEVFGE